MKKESDEIIQAIQNKSKTNSLWENKNT